MSARRKLLTNLALAAGSGALTLILAELILTGVLRLEAVTLEHDALLGFRGRPGLETPWRREMAGGERIVRTNVQGYHDHERQAATPAHTRRIVFLGDSFVEAYQVEVDENFTQRLGQSLTQRGGELGFAVEAVNQGVHGYGLGVHYLTVRQRLADWHPDAVVLALFLGNDLQDNFAPLASASVPRFRLLQGRLEYTPVPPYGLKTWLRDRVLARSTLMRLFWLRVVKANRSTMQMAREAGLISTPNLDTRSADYLPEMLGWLQSSLPAYTRSWSWLACRSSSTSSPTPSACTIWPHRPPTRTSRSSSWFGNAPTWRGRWSGRCSRRALPTFIPAIASCGCGCPASACTATDSATSPSWDTR